MKSITLLSSHYAAKWPTEGVHKTLEEVDQLGKQYAEHTDQDALLELCQCFHPYWMKYLVMICHGHGTGRIINPPGMVCRSALSPIRVHLWALSLWAI